MFCLKPESKKPYDADPDVYQEVLDEMNSHTTTTTGMSADTGLHDIYSGTELACTVNT